MHTVSFRSRVPTFTMHAPTLDHAQALVGTFSFLDQLLGIRSKEVKYTDLEHEYS